ncbi:restriction endonuclease subunit S [Priestia megaterium]|uniref:restriction endonuclease subunit S n=1 Tax=Priestia megaterium TaxID=1404 RepID=UPI000BA67865|nr:restriction endonuclease subunit S [Priestia megaterium]PAK43954.1 hypothetical protein CHH47_27475 [Priestia megaterium]
MNSLKTFELLRSKDILYIKGRIGWKGLKKEEFTETGPFLITGMHFKENGKIDWDRCFHIPQHRYDESPEIMLELEDILLTKDGTIGKVAFIDELPGPSSLNSHLLVLRVEDKKRVYPKYIFYSLQSDKFKKYIEKNKSGSTIVGLSQKAFENFEFALPDYRVQKKIAQILSTVDEQIANADQLIVKTKELKKGLMQYLFTKGLNHTKFKQTVLGDIPIDWDVTPLVNLMAPGSDGVKRGPFGGALKKEFFVSDGYAVYEQQHAIYNQFSKIRYYINEDKYQELKGFIIKENDILISCSGTVGKIAIVPKSIKPGVMNQALLRFRAKENLTDTLFLYYMLISDNVQSKMLDMTHGSTIKNMVAVSQIKTIPVVLPPLKEQRKIAQILSTVDEQIESHEQEKQKYIELKKGLMQQLLTEKLRVTV